MAAGLRPIPDGHASTVPFEPGSLLLLLEYAELPPVCPPSFGDGFEKLF